MRKLFIITIVAAASVLVACTPAPTTAITDSPNRIHVDGVTYKVDLLGSSTNSGSTVAQVYVTVTATNTTNRNGIVQVPELVGSDGNTYPAYPGRYLAAVLDEIAAGASEVRTFDYETPIGVSSVSLRYTSGGKATDLPL